MATKGGPQKIVTDGLVLYLDAANKKSYPGTASTWNNMMNDKTGSLYNSPSFNQYGYFEMDGVDDIIYGWSSILPYNVSECTIDIYVNISKASFWGQLFYIGQGSFNHNIPYVSFYTDTYDSTNHKITFGTNQTNAGPRGVHQISTSISPYLNKWVNIVGTMGNGKLEMFIDGIFKGTYNLPENWICSLNNQSIYIGGGLSSGFVSDVECKIANSKIYNRVLTISEIVQNYNSLSPKFL